MLPPFTIPPGRKFITTKELARRWNISHRTLENWRQNQLGPCWTKFGKKVAYSLEAVVAYEATHSFKGMGQ
jgi:hypothetical protein